MSDYKPPENEAELRAQAESLKTRNSRQCWAYPDRPRPCGECQPLRFGDGDYTFYAADFENEMDGKLGTIVARCSPETHNPDMATRLDRLTYEIPEELAKERDGVDEKAKYGTAWRFMRRSKIGREEQRFAAVLRGTETGRIRRACACEVAVWLNGHTDDRQNCEDNLNDVFGPFFEVDA